MEFEEIVTVRQIKRILHDPSAHVEQRYGTAKEAIEYCKKDNKFMEFGKPKAQGERTDLADVYESLKVGRSLLDIIEDTPERTYVILGESNVSKICSDGKCKNLKRGSNPLLLSTSDDPEPESPIITTMTPTIKRRDTSSQCNSPEKCTSTNTMENHPSGSTSLGDPYCLLEYSFDYATNWRHLWKRRDLPYASPISERYLSQQPRILRTGGEILDSIRKIQDSCGDDSPTCSTSRTSCLSTPNPSRSESQNTSEMKWPKNWIDVLKSGEDGDQEMQRWKESEATNPATQLLSTIVAMMGLSDS